MEQIVSVEETQIKDKKCILLRIKGGKQFVLQCEVSLHLYFPQGWRLQQWCKRSAKMPACLSNIFSVHALSLPNLARKSEDTSFRQINIYFKRSVLRRWQEEGQEITWLPPLWNHPVINRGFKLHLFHSFPDLLCSLSMFKLRFVFK